jgi:hypothetical protein
VRANLDNRVVIDEVPIGGHVGPSIRFFMASFSDGRLKRGRRVLESGAQDRRRAPLFLLLSRVLKIVVVCHSSYSDRRRVSLWMTMFRTGIACLSGTSCRRSTMPWVHKDESQCFPLPSAPLSTSSRQIFGVGSERTHGIRFVLDMHEILFFSIWWWSSISIRVVCQITGTCRGLSNTIFLNLIYLGYNNICVMELCCLL